jgi:hypothetical protein
MPITKIDLPVAQLNDINLSYRDTWNIVKVGFGKENIRQKVILEPEEGIPKLRVFYPKNSLSPQQAIQGNHPFGGLGFYAAPLPIFPANEVLFQYEVYLDDTFKPQKGGKLPGLYLSKGLDFSGASGGNKSKTNASCRIMWRQNNMAEAYVYTPTPRQSPDYYNIPNQQLNSKYGDSLWRGLFNLRKGQWNIIKIYIKLNSVPSKTHANPDGILIIKINEVEKTFSKMIWRLDKDVKVSALFVDTFYGGSTADYCCPNDTFLYFRNFSVSKTN